MDYDTRIYRLILDPTRTIVQKICCIGAGFPTSSPLGNAFNFNVEKPTSEENDQITINFECMGVCYYDPIVVYEFNDLVGLFNPSMRNSVLSDPASVIQGLKDGTYFKLSTIEEKNRYNGVAYPRINVKTMELEWYMPRNKVERI